MPFKKGNPGRPRNQNSKGRVNLPCSFEDATIFVTKNKNIVYKEMLPPGTSVIYFTNSKKDAEDFIKS